VVNKSLSLQQIKEELMKIRGHLVDMPLDFLIVGPILPWRLLTNEIGGERFDGSGKSSLECDYAELTFSELARCEPVHPGSLCLSKSFVLGRPQSPKSAQVEDQG
jgi:hypothetical protein